MKSMKKGIWIFSVGLFVSLYVLGVTKEEVSTPLPPSAASSNRTKVEETGKNNLVPAAPSVPTPSKNSSIDYLDYLSKQFDAFVEKDWFRNLAALPQHEPIAKIAISNVPAGIQTTFSLLNKIQPGFSAFAYFFVCSFIGGPQCPGVDTQSPCYVLLFPQGKTIKPLVCFKAKSDNIVVKNLQSEANQKGEYQLIHPFPLKENEFNAWFYAPKTLLSSIKDFSTVAPFFYGKPEPVTALIQIEYNTKALRSFLPFPFLRCFYDTYIQNDFEKIRYDIHCDEENFQLNVRHQAKPKSPWVDFCKSMQEALKTRRTLVLPSNHTVQVNGCCPYKAAQTCLEALSTRARLSDWSQDEFSHQLYQWGQIFYPIWIQYLQFGEQYLSGNIQRYAPFQSHPDVLTGEYFGLTEARSTLTDEKLVTFLQDFVQKTWRPQMELAQKKHLWESDSCKGPCSVDQKILNHHDCWIHGCSFGWKEGHLLGPKVFGLYKGYLLIADRCENIKHLIDPLKDAQSFSYLSHPNSFFSLKIRLADVKISKITFPPNTNVEFSSTVEVEPKTSASTLVSTVKIPLAVIEKVCAFYLGIEIPSPTPSTNENSKETSKSLDPKKLPEESVREKENLPLATPASTR